MDYTTLQSTFPWANLPHSGVRFHAVHWAYVVLSMGLLALASSALSPEVGMAGLPLLGHLPSRVSQRVQEAALPFPVWECLDARSLPAPLVGTYCAYQAEEKLC